ncbi:MAG: murein L,D-transpeptidase [Alphaproteobacteria bacterium]|nr:murein L,D-transpeptidase [Alphaproteobacteria bacterium]
MPRQPVLRFLSKDGNLDIEDVALAVERALDDGRLSVLEANELRQALDTWSERFEPAARRYLEDLLAGKARRLVNRVLLAPHPRGEPKDLYYARTDVVALQEALGWLGHPTAIDGDFGPGTGRALSAFQESQGIDPSGVLDSRTLSRMNHTLEAQGRPLVDLSPRARIRPDAVIAATHAADRDTTKALQRALNGLRTHYGLDTTRLSVDGDFGPATAAALRSLQAYAYLPETGILDVSTAEALNLLLAPAGLALLDTTPPEPDARPVELHFYPGPEEHKVYVLRGGDVLEAYGMVGGEPEARDDEHSDIDYSPTPAGTYEVIRVDPHASWSWAFSYVPFGSHLREVGGEIQFRDGGGVWRFATGPEGVFKDRTPPPLLAAHYRNSDGSLPPTWTRSEFGHLRGLLRDVRTGRTQGHMIHSSPYAELTKHYFTDTEALDDAASALDLLRVSHGCEHIHPKDMDELVARGWMRPGTRFVVHGYDERFSEGRALV